MVFTEIVIKLENLEKEITNKLQFINQTGDLHIRVLLAILSRDREKYATTEKKVTFGLTKKRKNKPIVSNFYTLPIFLIQLHGGIILVDQCVRILYYLQMSRK